ncbi:MAG: regulator of sigma E protease [Crocinitomicaceae bacterium]|jgi:regulator of sigma E protease
MEFWIKAAQLLLSLSILVFLHELGHFIPARIFKTRVEKFYLFFNPWFSIIKKKIGETEWGIGWIPLGGYVKISGMVDESMDKEQLAKPPQPWEFRSKPAWQRLIIMLGGVTVNIIVGIIIYIFVVFAWGEQQIPTKDFEHGLAVHPYMQKYDLHSGDNVLAINGVDVLDPNDINKGLLIRNQYDLKVKRANGNIETLHLKDGMEYDMFSNGATRAFDLRTTATEVDYMFNTSELTLGKGDAAVTIKAQSTVISINGKAISDLKEISASDYKDEKTVAVKIARAGDTSTVSIPGAKMSALLYVCPALSSGMRQGDKIRSIAGTPITYFDEILTTCYNNKGKTVPLTVLRDTSVLDFTVRVNSDGAIGFAVIAVKAYDYKHIKDIKYGFGESIGRGFTMGMTTLNDYVGQLKFLFTKKGATSIGGFGAIGGLFPGTWNWEIFWMNTALISIILAFMNVLPIPALDGGHVVFLLYEMITGKEAPQKVLEYAQVVGFFILIALLLYANGNDIYRYITG